MKLITMVLEKKVGQLKKLCWNFLLCVNQNTRDFTVSVVGVRQ